MDFPNILQSKNIQQINRRAGSLLSNYALVVFYSVTQLCTSSPGAHCGFPGIEKEMVMRSWFWQSVYHKTPGTYFLLNDENGILYSPDAIHLEEGDGRCLSGIIYLGGETCSQSISSNFREKMLEKFREPGLYFCLFMYIHLDLINKVKSLTHKCLSML